MGTLSLLSPEIVGDPYSVFRTHRPNSPVVLGHSKGSSIWSILSYSQVEAVLRDHGNFSSAGFGEFHTDLFRLVLINDDQPRHTRIRKLVAKSFSRRTVAALEPWITDTIESKLIALADKPTDFMGAFAKQLPLYTICTLLGIPDRDITRIETWLRTVLRPGEQTAEARSAQITDLVGYLNTLIATRRRMPLNDLLGMVAGGEDDDLLSDADTLGYAMLLLIAGTESTTYLLGNAANILAQNPEIWDRLRNSPELIDEFVEETLRVESPVQLLPRRAIRDVTLGGKTIPNGALVFVHYGSANRDPQEFEQPDLFSLDRDLRTHMGFGAGIHFCLGSPLARVETQIMVTTLLSTFERIEPAGTARRQTTSAGFYGFEYLPLHMIPK